MRIFQAGLLAPVLAATLLSAAATAATGTTSPVVGMQNFIHSVANVEKSIAFYHDVFGLEPTSELRPPIANPAILGMVNARGAKFRVASFKLPNAGFGLELTEFTGIPNKPAQPNHWDPGAADLTLRVRDVNAVFAALKKAGAPIISLSGAPVKIGPPASNIRSVLTRDPDGYILEVIQVEPIAADAPAGMIVGASMGLTVGDTAKTLVFYHDILGFEIKPGDKFMANNAILDMVGAKSGEVKQSAGTIPTTAARIEFYEFKGIDRKPFQMRIPDPGSVAMSLIVDDVDGLLKRLKAAGTKVITVSGEPVQVSPASRNVFVEDPNGVAIELIQHTK
jgi:catechol 2,3-dioxygenase-like lactoylglutathione lyase family enzyme